MDDAHDEHFQQHDDILRSGATPVVAHPVGGAMTERSVGMGADDKRVHQRLVAVFLTHHPEARSGIFPDGRFTDPVAKWHIQWLVAQGLVADPAQVPRWLSSLTHVEPGAHP